MQLGPSHVLMERGLSHVHMEIGPSQCHVHKQLGHKEIQGKRF